MMEQQQREKKLYPNLVRAVVTALTQIFKDGLFADKVIEHTLKSNRKWGARDRSFIAESLYDMVRWYRLLYEIAGQEPNTEKDWWELFGILQIIRGTTLPDWQEFKNIAAKTVLVRHQELQQIRKIRESIPDWLDALGSQALGDTWDATLPALNQTAKVVLRTNRLKTDPDSLQKALLAEGIETNRLSGDALWITKRKNLFQTKTFRQGWFEVQDYSSQQVAPFLEVKPGMQVVDACAGGGGKSLHLAALMQNKGQLISLDTESWKLDQLRKRASRGGVQIIETHPITGSKIIDGLTDSADRLLLDVPCSGLGVLRRNPDAKWKLSPDFVNNIIATQRDILSAYNRILRSGGKMVYATCSVLPAENQQQVTAFLGSHEAEFSLEKEKVILPQDEGFDGFYMALLRKH